MDADPRTDPYLRRHLVAVAKAHARVGARQRRRRCAGARGHAGRHEGAEPQRAVRARRSRRGHLREAPPRAVRRVRAVPLRARGWIHALDRVPRDFEPGDRPGIFEIAGHKVATIICFESAFGYQVRPLVRDGAQVIVVSTNNRSYERSANSAQHVAIGQMRAAETGRPVVQAAISGISAIIDANGVVHQHTALRPDGARGDRHRDDGGDALRSLRRMDHLVVGAPARRRRRVLFTTRRPVAPKARSPCRLRRLARAS